MKKRLAIIGAIATVAVAVAVGVTAYVAANPKESMVKISVRRFEYIPHEIVIKKGVPVTLELESQDVIHGFNAPDLGIRSDVVPGKLTRVQVVPQKAGRFTVHCDVFCGAGHEDLFGTIVVED